MEDQPKLSQTWWQKNKRFLIIATVIIIALLLIFALAVYWFGWDWTGFNMYSITWTAKTSTGTRLVTVDEIQPAKTLWDLLQLAGIVAIPIVVGLGVAGFTSKQAQVSEEANRKQRQTELEIAINNQREVALQAYIDKMSELLLEKRLRDSTEDAEVRKIAYVRTLTILLRLNPSRKRSVLHFLYRSGLINISKPVVSLDGADLSNADLSDADFEGVNLGGIDILDSSTGNPSNLSPLEIYLTKVSILSDTALSVVRLNGVNLNRAYLVRTNLKGSHLFGANLNDAALCEANLSNAYLIGSSFQRANLSGTNFYRANLTGANFKDSTGITIDELDKQASSLKGAIMPDGTLHP